MSKHLTYLEDYTNILDSTVYSNIQSKILNIEHKYNHLKISKEVDNLKNEATELHHSFCYLHCSSAVNSYRLFIIQKTSKRENLKTVKKN